MTLLKEQIVAEVTALRENLVLVADDLYHHPETGLEEHQSSALLTALLEAAGFCIERGVAGMETAFRAVYGTGSITIALLAEMDALPGLGHGCGHNIIAAAAIGAALALAKCLAVSDLRVVVLGTPAEELGIGKIEMIKAGLFSTIDYALMVHPSSRRQVIKGYLGLAKIRFTFFGKAAHAGAYPAEGINALEGVLQTFNGINALRQHLQDNVRIHGIITEGGVAPNIIPERAQCFFYVRAPLQEELEMVTALVKACAEGASLMTGCRLESVQDERVIAPMKINYALSELYSRQLAYLGLPETHRSPFQNMGSSDIGNVSQLVPTIHPHVPIGEGIHIHSEAFARATVSEEGRHAVWEGACALALTAADLVLQPELRERICQEFSKKENISCTF